MARHGSAIRHPVGILSPSAKQTDQPYAPILAVLNNLVADRFTDVGAASGRAAVPH
ncbi:hypothetical protein G155_12270 [Mycobacterium sp. VKM Ac-1817D]|nr:hypothetical protein G155_12270 [Mycobacterium sp. VKM Ac-1817D]